ncbi:hypothetical protein BTA37_28420 [Priestia megaterium]|uniref:hypothetical protein n=1 Tax=Priestia megaterium TaxID=1404 RepID=UPI00094C20B1|nr:hypothetical protein [Priestia megaterium]OLO26228.1 hypothetical protein BTA37_28420 [Priestia megaterium]
MDFLQNQILMYTSKKYENIYMHLNSEFDLPYYRLFLMCAAIGARNSHSIEVKEKGREFRSNYFDSDERNLAYSLILNDEINGKNLDRFNDKAFYAEARKLLESYAEGGMEILVKQVFKEKWDGIQLDKSHLNYPIDILTYVVATLKEVPF